MKKILEKKIVVSKEDLDDLNHVNNIVYIHWILDIAKKHWESLVSSQTLENYHWVLLDHNIKYLRPALLKDKIIIKTFVEKTAGVKSSRVVEIYNDNSEKLLVSSITNWCLISSKTNKPCRIPKEIIEVFS